MAMASTFIGHSLCIIIDIAKQTQYRHQQPLHITNSMMTTTAELPTFWGSNGLTLVSHLLHAHGLPPQPHVLVPLLFELEGPLHPETIVPIINQLGFDTQTVELPAEKLAEAPLPALTYLRTDGPPQAVLLTAYDNHTCRFLHRTKGWVTLPTQQFLVDWLPICLLAVPTTPPTPQAVSQAEAQLEAARQAYQEQLIYKDDFLDESEINTLLQLAEGKIHATNAKVEGYRHHDVALISDVHSPALEAIMAKALALLPTKAAYYPEPDEVFVISYGAGMENKAHYDSYGKQEAAEIGQVVWTMLMYLTDDYEGGETVFPHLGLEVRGKKGGILCFPDLDAQGQIAPYSLHEGKMVTQGVKQICSFWMKESNLL